MKEGQAEFSCYPVPRCERLARQHRDQAKVMLSCRRRGGGAGSTAVGRNLGDKEYIPAATEASLLHVAVLLHQSALRFYLHLIGMCIYMNKPLHKSQIVNISVHFFPLFGWGKDTYFSCVLGEDDCCILSDRLSDSSLFGKLLTCACWCKGVLYLLQRFTFIGINLLSS